MILSAEYAYRYHDHITVTAQIAAATATLRPEALLNACLPITIAAYEFHGACTSAFAAIQLLDLHTLFYSPKFITCLLCIKRKCCFPPDLYLSPVRLSLKMKTTKRRRAVYMPALHL